MNIIDVTPTLSDDELHTIAERIEQIRREDWILTYPNKERGITEDDIKEALPPLEEHVEWTYHFLLEHDESEHIFVAKEGNTIIGFCNLALLPIPNIHALYITPSMIGKGVGTELMKRALSITGEHDMTLEVAEYNTRAIDFYTSFGFVTTGKGEFVMKRLTPPKIIPTTIMERKYGSH